MGGLPWFPFIAAKIFTKGFSDPSPMMSGSIRMLSSQCLMKHKEGIIQELKIIVGAGFSG
jgi:hypothetical protein